MTPYVLSKGYITKQNVALFTRMRKLVEQMDDMETNGILLSCHLICHALATHFPVEVGDGYFAGNYYQHSWLILWSHDDRNVIIADMCPVAGATPFLVVSSTSSPWGGLYKRDRSRLGKILDDPSFPQQVAIVAQHIQDLGL